MPRFWKIRYIIAAVAIITASACGRQVALIPISGNPWHSINFPQGVTFRSFATGSPPRTTDYQCSIGLWEKKDVALFVSLNNFTKGESIAVKDVRDMGDGCGKKLPCSKHKAVDQWGGIAPKSFVPTGFYVCDSNGKKSILLVSRGYN
jgi:hypothetical protein